VVGFFVPTGKLPGKTVAEGLKYVRAGVRAGLKTVRAGVKTVSPAILTNPRQNMQNKMNFLKRDSIHIVKEKSPGNTKLFITEPYLFHVCKGSVQAAGQR
jgi:hypothetical protein